MTVSSVVATDFEMSKRQDAIWDLTLKLATKLNAEIAKGNVVLWDTAVIKAPFVLDVENQQFKEVSDDGKMTFIIHDGTGSWGRFETLKEVKQFFTKRITVLQPIKWI